MSKLLLIDGHSILNRAFYGVPDLTNSAGLHTNAVYGFLNMLFKVMEEEKPDYLLIAFDLKEKTFRHKMFEAYKGTRKPMPEELHQQVPVIKQVLAAMNITIVTKAGYEADDILGTLAFQAEKAGLEVTIMSGDRDLLQLATKKIKISIPKTKKGVTEIENYYWDNVIDLYNVNPREFIDVKALMGDASDNIPGVTGIGEKTASKIIAQYHSIENAYEHIEELTPNKARLSLQAEYDIAKLSKTLATIDTQVPLDISYKDGEIKDIYNDASYEEISKLEFKSILAKFNKNGVVANETVDLDSLTKEIKDLNAFNKMIKEIKDKELIGIDLIDIKPEENQQLTFDFISEPVEDTIFGSIFDGKTLYIIDSSKIDKNSSKEVTAQLKNVLETQKLAVFGLKNILKIIDFKDNNNILDCEIGGYLLNPLKDKYFYEDICRDYLKYTLKSREELIGKADYSTVYKNDRHNLIMLTSCNSFVAYKGYKVLLSELKNNGMEELYYNIELPLIYSLNRMEKEGIRLDATSLKEYGLMLKESIEKLEKDIYTQCNVEFNINSPKQLGEVLFEKMGLKGGKKTKTGYSTSAEVLEKLKEENPVIKDILEYRQLTKLKSTYADGLINYVEADDRIHGTFNQTITATGRISSTEPNLQNIPIRMPLGSLIRKVFIPKENCVFVDADYSQIELRILAHMSEDESLIEAYNSGMDIHSITASKVFNVPLEQVTKQQRSNAKAVNFGIVYGMSAFGLSQDLSISRKEATEYINQYFETYPKVKEYLDNIVAFAKEKGYVKTLFGRKRPIPELKSSNFMQKSFGERIAMNSPIQGTAADIMKIAMINVDKRLQQENMKSRIVLQVHDELLVEAYKDEVDKVSEILSQEMSNAANLSVNLDVDVNVGDNWLEAH